MKRLTLALVITGGPLLILAAPLPKPSPPLCHVTVYRDYTLGFVYYAQIVLKPNCPPDGVARVRKSSSTSLKENGAPYQPVLPLKGAWEVRQSSSTIPANAHYTLSSWDWQERTGTRWQTVDAE